MHELSLRRRHKKIQRSLRLYKVKCKHQQQLKQQQLKQLKQQHIKHQHKRLPLRLQKYHYHEEDVIIPDNSPEVINVDIDDDDVFAAHMAESFADDETEMVSDYLSDSGSTDWGNDHPEDIIEFLGDVYFDDEDKDEEGGAISTAGSDDAAKEIPTQYSFSPADVNAALLDTDFWSYWIHTRGKHQKQAKSDMTRLTWMIQFIMRHDPEVFHYKTLADVTAAIIRGGYKWLQQICTWLSENKHRRPKTVDAYVRIFNAYLRWFTTHSVDNVDRIHGGKVTRVHLMDVEDAVEDMRGSLSRKVRTLLWFLSRL